MCEFPSWIEYNGEVYFLKNGDLETKAGKKLLGSVVKDDLCGHGAIVSYYPELMGKGKHCESICFSSPDNFPDAVVAELKKGNMSRIGIALDILNAEGRAEYKKIEAPALAECNKINASALAEYEKIKVSAFSKIVKQKKYREDIWK